MNDHVALRRRGAPDDAAAPRCDVDARRHRPGPDAAPVHEFGRVPILPRGEREETEPVASADPSQAPAARAELPVDFVGPLGPGDTRAVPADFIGPPGPGATRSSAFHPTMTVVTPGTADSSCGAFRHKVKWGVPSALNRSSGWIIQKVGIRFDVQDCTGKPVAPHPIDDPANYPFWEAWEFTSGGDVWVGPAAGGTAHSGDTFSGNDYGPGTKGKISLIGEVKGIVGFTLPAGMTVRNAEPAWSLPYTRTAPADFTRTLPGAAHVVTAEWDCCPAGTTTKATTVAATP